MEPNEIKSHFDAGLEGIRAQVAQVNNEIKAAFEQKLEEIKKNGAVDPETKEKIERLFKRQDDLEARMDHAMSSSTATQKEVKTVSSNVLESKKYQDAVKADFRGDFRHVSFPIEESLFPYVEGKAILESAQSTATSGVIGIERIPEVITLMRRELRVRDLIPVFRTNSPNIDYLRQATFTNLASPQVEGSAKSESTLTYDTVTTSVRTLAHFIRVSTQALSDMPQLRSDIDDWLMYGLKLKEEDELLTGSGTGQHLNGIITQATAYNTGLNVAGDTKLDKIRHYILQARQSLFPVDGIVLNPKDMHDIDLIKTNNGGANTGNYVVGDPKAGPTITMLWGKPVVESDAITSGNALVGAFRFGARIFDRMKATIDISLEDQDNFVTNRATIRAEERLALAVIRPTAFIYGAL